jgi:hypothetical protein
MARRHSLFLAFLTLVAGFPAAAPHGSSMTAGQIQSADQIQAADESYSYSYFNPHIISPNCVYSADPLRCTAEEGAMTLEADAMADAVSPELTTPDGAVFDTPSFDSSSALDRSASPSTLDSATSLDPTVQIGEVAAAVPVRRIVRGFNTRQEADYLGDKDPLGNPDLRRWNRAWKLIAGTHVRVHRLAVYWWDVQCRGAGQWEWTKYVKVAQAAENRNIRLILTPVGSPNWARNEDQQTPTQTDPPNPCIATDKAGLGIFAHPDMLDAWAEFIRHLVVVFKPFNPIGYEIWNEENSRDFWDRVGIPDRIPQPPCPSCWTRLYCLATGQIDTNDSGKAVGVGGLAAYHQNQYVTVIVDNEEKQVLKNMRSSAFLQRAYAAQATIDICAEKPFDYVGYHPYVYRRYYDGMTPKGGIGNTPEMLELTSVRNVMIGHNQAAKRIWNTEWGFPSGTFVDSGDTHRISEARQARLIVQEHTYLANRKDPSGFHYMRFSILFNPIDSFPDDVFSHVGVVWVSHKDKALAEDPEQWRKKPSYGKWASLPQP